jgi:hypothetical protein
MPVSASIVCITTLAMDAPAFDAMAALETSYPTI